MSVQDCFKSNLRKLIAFKDILKYQSTEPIELNRRHPSIPVLREAPKHNPLLYQNKLNAQNYQAVVLKPAEG